MLKKGFVILVAVLIMLAIIGLLLPRNVHSGSASRGGTTSAVAWAPARAPAPR